MTIATLSRQRAAKLTLIAQAAAGVVLVAGVAALAAGWRGGPQAKGPGEFELPVPKADPKLADQPAREVVDVPAVAERLVQIANRPIAKAPEVVATPEGPKTTPEVAPTAEARFLGAVGVGAARMALVSHNGKQRFYIVGDKLDGNPVEEISDTEVRIGGDAPKVLQLAQRTADVLTRGKLGPAVPMRPGVQPMAGGVQPMITPVPAQPEYRPDYAMRYEQLRSELKNSGRFNSEEEINEAAARQAQYDTEISEKIRELEKVGDKESVARLRKEQMAEQARMKEKGGK